MIAIGKKAPREHLPPELQEKEYPNDRKPLKDIASLKLGSIAKALSKYVIAPV
ncbi:MAG: hypothetical protein WAM14_09940 [Candidatus Nitrosopolaris sp.]